MSISDFELKWIKFTKSLRSVGVLLIFVMIPFLAFVIIPIQFILTMVAIRDIKIINHELNDPYLKNFRSKYLAASILKFIGSIIVHVGGVMITVIIIISPIIYPFYLGYPSVGRFIPAIVLFIIGFVIMIIGSSVEVGAWDNLQLFLYHNKGMFPKSISYRTTNSVENLRKGASLWAIGFLIIPIIIGWIYQLVGYFGLINAIKEGRKIEPIAPKTQDYQPISPHTQEPQPIDVIEFCPMCGSSVVEGAIYCGECGVKIVN